MAERRKRGTGSIRQKKCGTWEARYTAYRDEEGKVVRKTFCCDTKKECEERLRRACEKRDREEALKKEEAYRVAIENVEKHRLKSKTLTVKEWMDYWYLNLSKPYIRPSTAAGYENILEHHIYPYLGNVKLSELTPFEVQDLINYSFKCGNKYNLGKGLSAKTVKEIYRLLFQGMESGVAFEIINKNPCKGCKLPKIERNEMKYLTYDGIGRYLVAAEARGMLPMFYLELSTGLRRGELISLMWTDLDIHDRMLYIRRTANRVKGYNEILIGTPKTQNSIRQIKLPQETVDLLIQEHEKHPDNVYMFPSPVGGGIWDPTAISNLHKKILKDAGLQDIRFHDLRHTFATLALESGVDVKTLSSYLGHYDTTFTLMTYAHVSTRMQNDAARKVGFALQNAYHKNDIYSDDNIVPIMIS